MREDEAPACPNALAGILRSIVFPGVRSAILLDVPLFNALVLSGAVTLSLVV